MRANDICHHNHLDICRQTERILGVDLHFVCGDEPLMPGASRLLPLESNEHTIMLTETRMCPEAQFLGILSEGSGADQDKLQ